MQVTISFWCRTPDGVDRKPGDVVEVEEKAAQMLIRDGLAQPAPEPEPAAEPAPAVADPVSKPRKPKPDTEPQADS